MQLRLKDVAIFPIMVSYACRDCGDTAPEHFTATSLKNRLCRVHMNKRKRKHRAGDVARVIMARLHGHGSPGFGLAEVRLVLGAFQHRSVISGKSDDITIARIDRGLPLTVDNAMVIDVREPRDVPSEIRERAKRVAAGKVEQSK